ncbi:UNVERIFIED_CONTAM: hypothetical protein RMT77_005339 [Armadillidium vulgare]
MENSMDSENHEAGFVSTANVHESVGLSRKHSASLKNIVQQENIADVIVSNDDVIISPDVLISGKESPSIKRECLELDVNSSSVHVSSRSLETFQRKRKTVFTGSWKEAAQQEVLHVYCRKITGELHKNRFGSGAKGKSIRVGKVWLTPSEFEAHCGRSASKDWKRSIRFQGQTLQTLIEGGFLQVHASSCSCAVCLEDTLAAGPVRLYQQCKRRRKIRVEDMKPLKICNSQEYSSCETTITLPVSELNPLSNTSPAVTTIAEVTVDISSLESVSNQLPLDRAWDQMSEAFYSLEKNARKAREMFESLRERTTRELDEQRRILLQEKEEAVNQAKIEAHLSSMERPAESEFLVEVRNNEDETCEEGEVNSTTTLQPVMIDALTTSIPNLAACHEKKKCVNCNRECSMECSSCRRKWYCSLFCQRRDWPSHRDECDSLRASPSAGTPGGYIFMLSD